jgi:ankyrin repeat protein
MIDKLPILINTLLFSILLSSCKPLSLHMTGDSEITELDEATIISILKENNVLTSPNEALFWTVENNQPEVAKWIICKQGANVNVKDKYGYTPLHFAAEKGHTAVAELLIKAGADFDAKNDTGDTPLHKAAWKGHTTVVELLIKASADFDEQDEDGYTPLHNAAYNGHTEVAELLINAGVEFNVQNKHGNTPSHEAALRNKAAFFGLLASSRVNIIAALYEVRSSKGEQLLSNDNFDRNLLRPILRYGDWNMNLTNNQGETPLDIAKKRGHTEIVEILEDIVSTYENQEEQL